MDYSNLQACSINCSISDKRNGIKNSNSYYKLRVPETIHAASVSCNN